MNRLTMDSAIDNAAQAAHYGQNALCHMLISGNAVKAAEQARLAARFAAIALKLEATVFTPWP